MIELFPYVNLPDKGWTFSDDRVVGFYAQMVQDGTFETVFSDGTVRSALDFLNLMKSNKGVLYLVFETIDGHPVRDIAIVWLNDFQARWAQFHFCVFSGAWGDGIEEIGQEVIRRIMTMKTLDGGRYLHDMILGIVPSWNDRAIEYVKEVGGKVLCTLPLGCFNVKENRSEPGVLFCATRDILGVEK